MMTATPHEETPSTARLIVKFMIAIGIICIVLMLVMGLIPYAS